MRDDLLYYYERELAFLRRTGADFAARYPKIAARLQLEATKCDDPHVERLLEGFAFLAARVHLKLADDFSEITEALLNVVYPHYTRPIPSLALVQFDLDPEQGKLTGGFRIDRGRIIQSPPVAGTVCKFQTCYDTTLWPLTVTAAEWIAPHQLPATARPGQATAALRLELRCFPDVTFDKLELESLRLHISAELNLGAALYELLCNNTIEVVAREPGSKKAEVVRLEPGVLEPVGFGQNESLLPAPRRSFLGYRLLQEYFTLPEKFLFLDLHGFDRIRQTVKGDRLELLFPFSSFERADRRPMLETGITADTIRLGCTPVINLFPQTSEPILLTQRQPEYMVVPDARRRESICVYGIDEVLAVTPGRPEPMRVEPLYSFRHGNGGNGQRLFWYATRRATGWRPDKGTDVYLSFVDYDVKLTQPDADTVTTRLTCYNGDLPSRLPFGNPDGDFEMPGGAPIARILTLLRPTPVIQPPMDGSRFWRLISLLSLNYVSLIEGGADALREMLRVHNVGDSSSGEKQIEGILSLRSAPGHARIHGEHGPVFARGHRVEIEFDEEQYVGGGVYLMASVLERFLGLYTSLNSFVIMAARTRQRKQLLREWPPRSGWKTLL